MNRLNTQLKGLKDARKQIKSETPPTLPAQPTSPAPPLTDIAGGEDDMELAKKIKIQKNIIKWVDSKEKVFKKEKTNWVKRFIAKKVAAHLRGPHRELFLEALKGTKLEEYITKKLAGGLKGPADLSKIPGAKGMLTSSGGLDMQSKAFGSFMGAASMGAASKPPEKMSQSAPPMRSLGTPEEASQRAAERNLENYRQKKGGRLSKRKLEMTLMKSSGKHLWSKMTDKEKERFRVSAMAAGIIPKPEGTSFSFGSDSAVSKPPEKVTLQEKFGGRSGADSARIKKRADIMFAANPKMADLFHVSGASFAKQGFDNIRMTSAFRTKKEQAGAMEGLSSGGFSKNYGGTLAKLGITDVGEAGSKQRKDVTSKVLEKWASRHMVGKGFDLAYPNRVTSQKDKAHLVGNLNTTLQEQGAGWAWGEGDHIHINQGKQGTSATPGQAANFEKLAKNLIPASPGNFVGQTMQNEQMAGAGNITPPAIINNVIDKSSNNRSDVNYTGTGSIRKEPHSALMTT